MPLILRLADIPGLDPESDPVTRDLAVTSFLDIARDVWQALASEFKAEKLSLFETFPGEHLGGRRLGQVGGAGEISPTILARMSPTSSLAEHEASSLPRVHVNHSIEVEGTIRVEGVPTLYAVLHLNLYRAWAAGSKEWPGAGDIVLEVLKSGSAPFDGLWEVCRKHVIAMDPVLDRWMRAIGTVSQTSHERHRIRWAALRETSAADDPPTTGAFAVYKARISGRASLLSANLKPVATEELSSLVGEKKDPLRRSVYRTAVERETSDMISTPAFETVADRFQAEGLYAYAQGGSEYFVFRDPDTPAKAARALVRRVKPKLEGRVRERMNEAFAWETELSSLEPEQSVPRKGKGVLDSYPSG